MTLRVFESFAGVGTQRMALERANIPHEVVGISEIDKFVIKSYEAIHKEIHNYGDIAKIDPKELPNFDLYTYSFPCTDLSLSGKMTGMGKGSGTSSSLLWESEKIIREKRPKYLLMENVKNLIGNKFKEGFHEWLEILEALGYTNYWEVLNATGFNIPQNRERVFCVSILGEHTSYKFPEESQLTKRLTDIIEPSVEEKYYLDEKRATRVLKDMIENGKLNFSQDLHDPSLQVNATQVVRLGGIIDKNGKKHQAGSIYDKNGCSPTLDTAQGGWRQPSIIVDDTQGFDGIRYYNTYSPTLRAQRSGLKTLEYCEDKQHLDESNLEESPAYIRIRKLTPKEYWRLMGISDEYFNKAQEVNSNTQLYKQAGNAIVVNVLEGIFTNLFK